MKRMKPYKEIIWDIVKSENRVMNPVKTEYGDISASTTDGKVYYFALGKDNTLLFMLDGGVSESYLDVEQRESLMNTFSEAFRNAHLYFAPLVDRESGKIVFVVSVFVEYRWAGLKEFRRCLGDMCAKIEQCNEWAKSHLLNLSQRQVNIDFEATHNLLVDNNY